MPPSVFSSQKGKRLSFVLPSCFMILSEALCLEGMQDWESWWVPVPYGSHMELELQHGRNCCSSSLNPSAHQWLCKTGQRDLDQAAWLWQGSWANLSPFWPAQGTIAWARVGDSISWYCLCISTLGFWMVIDCKMILLSLACAILCMASSSQA